MNFDSYKEKIREKLDDFRYHHSLCVAEEAVRLTSIYGGDPEKAYLAGLLHDITKNYSDEEHLKIFKMFDIILSDVEKNSSKLWHAISGAAYVHNILGISDEDIISAIRYHTTAKRDMSLLQRIIYLADFTSADRSYTDVDVMRKLVNESMDKAMAYSLEYTIGDLQEKGYKVHPDTLAAYEEIKSKINSEEI